MFRLRRMGIDTQSEHVIFIHADAVDQGVLGFKPMDRVLVSGEDPETGKCHEITGILNFCDDSLIEIDDIGLSTVAFKDLALPEGTTVRAALAASPTSVDRVRGKLRQPKAARTDGHASVVRRSRTGAALLPKTAPAR